VAIRIRLWLQCRWENGPAASELCPQKRMTASWSGPTWFNRIQAWFAGDCLWPMAGSPRIITRQISRHGQFAAVLALVKDKPSAALRSAVLDPRCARRRCQHAVGTEECSQRGSNKRMKKGSKKWCAPT